MENQSKKKDSESRTGLGKVKIINLSVIWLVITLCVIAMLFAASRDSNAAVSNQKMLTEKTMRCVELAGQMQSGSDILTDSVWRFVATGKEEYAKAYIEEEEVNRSRDIAIESLRQEGLLEEELQMMEEVKQTSDDLMVKEFHSMRLVYEAYNIEKVPPKIEEVKLTEEEQALSAEEQKTEASKFVFGEEYAQEKTVIKNGINAFTVALKGRQNAELTQAMKRTDQARTLQQAAIILLFVWFMGFMMIFHWLLIHPISSCCKELKESKDGNSRLKLQGPYELQCLISAFNMALVRIQDKNEKISNIQMVDPVTGGFTAARFDMEAAGYLKMDRPFAFVSLDIRRFKLINDVYGSGEGDRALKEVYKAVSGCLGKDEYVSRIQSDIFNIILCETDTEKIERRIEEINHAINKRYNEKEENAYYLSVNCGVYQVSKGESDIINIRDRANVARKISKSEAGYLTGCVFYTELERQRLLKEQIMENEMEHALEAEEFAVYLQPKVRLADGSVAGAEALVRWNSTSFGVVPPDEFIPLFEKNGFILKLDIYMFTQVCRLLKSWIDRGKEMLPVSVNLSRKHIEENGFVHEFIKIQERYQIPPKLIEFELTEAMVFENLPRLKEIIAEIHDAGYRCSMDDFGSGYSSLNVLKEVPVDILKLDRGFFVGGDTERGFNVVKAVIHMAKELNMEIVAEGIETMSLVRSLKEQGCDMVQGYVFFRPMPAREFEKNILDSRPR